VFVCGIESTCDLCCTIRASESQRGGIVREAGAELRHMSGETAEVEGVGYDAFVGPGEHGAGLG
jgi:hypothetical protein